MDVDRHRGSRGRRRPDENLDARLLPPEQHMAEIILRLTVVRLNDDHAASSVCQKKGAGWKVLREDNPAIIERPWSARSSALEPIRVQQECRRRIGPKVARAQERFGMT